LSRLADNAARRGRPELAIQIYRSLAEFGDAEATDRLTDVLVGSGRIDDAIALLSTCAGLHYTRRRAQLLAAQGRVLDAMGALRAPAEAGDSTAVVWLGDLLIKLGPIEEIEKATKVTADERGFLAVMLRKVRQDLGFDRQLPVAALDTVRAGNPHRSTLEEAAERWEQESKTLDLVRRKRREETDGQRMQRLDEDIGALRRSLVDSDTTVVERLVDLLAERGVGSGGWPVFATNPESGGVSPYDPTDEAIELLRRYGDSDDPVALRRLVTLLERRDRRDEAIEVQRRLVDGTDNAVAAGLVKM
jgi:tetratricopeptide (TPR) repeat protein